MNKQFYYLCGYVFVQNMAILFFFEKQLGHGKIGTFFFWLLLTSAMVFGLIAGLKAMDLAIAWLKYQLGNLRWKMQDFIERNL